jgi:hypothetical protein
VNALRRAVRVALFNRNATAGLTWDEAATADAVLIVAAVAVLTALVRLLRVGAFDLILLIETAIYAVARWIIIAVAVWFAATRLFRSSGSMQTMMRAAGFASLPLILEVVPYGAIVGVVWFLAALVVATSEAMDLDLKTAAASVLIGAAAVALLQLIFRIPFILFS